MKLAKQNHFSVPDCILDDGLSDKAFRLLVFLFRISDMAGRCSPGYRAIQEGVSITCRNTVTKSLAELRRHGWFEFVKKGNGQTTVFLLRLPPRFTPAQTAKNVVRMAAK